MTTKFDVIDWPIYRGDTETRLLSITQNSAPYNLTGYSITCQARLTEDSASALFQVPCTDLQNGSSYGAGVVAVVLPAAATKNLANNAVADVRAVLSTVETTLAKFRLLVTKDVTRV